MENVENKLLLENAKNFLSFLNSTPTQYHVVEKVKEELFEKEFVELKEKESWESKLKLGGKYFITRNGSCIFAFVIGNKFKSGNGYKIIGGHTDSPALRLKPKGKDIKEGVKTIQVTCYGGGIFRSWFDREYSLAGKVIVKKKGTNQIQEKLCHIKDPILTIPSLAIHLDTNRSEFKFSKEAHLAPILTTIVEEQIKDKDNKKEKKEKKSYEQHEELMQLIAKNVNCEVGQIEAFSLSLVDCCEAKIGGINKDMIHAYGLDNKFSCFCAKEGLINSLSSIKNEEYVRIIALYDHEEIGSNSRLGAKSMILNSIIQRINTILSTKETPKDSYYTSIAKSFIISSDNAHAVHPNYSSSHHSKFKPKMNKGITIKININQKYTTNEETLTKLVSLMKKNDIPHQLFQVSNDSRCGSTIGPHTSTQTGIRAIDVGAPQLAMHSVRETCGSHDCYYFIKLFEKFFQNFQDFDY